MSEKIQKPWKSKKKPLKAFIYIFWCPIVWTYAVNEEGYTEGKYEIIIFKIVLASSCKHMNKKTYVDWKAFLVVFLIVR